MALHGVNLSFRPIEIRRSNFHTRIGIYYYLEGILLRRRARKCLWRILRGKGGNVRSLSRKYGERRVAEFLIKLLSHHSVILGLCLLTLSTTLSRPPQRLSPCRCVVWCCGGDHVKWCHEVAKPVKHTTATITSLMNATTNLSWVPRQTQMDSLTVSLRCLVWWRGPRKVVPRSG